jgi:hypothetical protein
LMKTGDFQQAEVQLISLRKKYPYPQKPLWGGQVLWLSAKIDHGLGKLAPAEKQFQLGLNRLSDLEEPLYTALLLLDLALLYSETKRLTKTIEISIQILPIFESMKLYDETMSVIRLFSIAIIQTNVTSSILRDLRHSLERDPLLEVMLKRSQGNPDSQVKQNSLISTE